METHRVKYDNIFDCLEFRKVRSFHSVKRAPQKFRNSCFLSCDLPSPAQATTIQDMLHVRQEERGATFSHIRLHWHIINVDSSESGYVGVRPPLQLPFSPHRHPTIVIASNYSITLCLLLRTYTTATLLHAEELMMTDAMLERMLLDGAKASITCRR